MLPSISHRIIVKQQHILKDGKPVANTQSLLQPTAEMLYTLMQYNYPKFFKMDILCKWAWLASEMLLIQNSETVYADLDKTKIAVALATSHACMEADKRYNSTIDPIPSPALFVYTLPNIMLGEICIRHGFKGEQLCLLSEQPDWHELHFTATDMLQRRGMDACLCGWIDITTTKQEAYLYWITKSTKGIAFSTTALRELATI